MAKIESLRRAPEPSGNGHDTDGNGWAGLNPELLDLLSAGDPPAFATDSRERIVFWNSGAAGLLGRRSEEALGRRCSEIICGRDVFGNRFCYQNCPVSAMARSSEPISGFEMRVPSPKAGADPALVHVTILRIPGPRPDLFTLVHMLQPIDHAARLARALSPVAGPSPSPRPDSSAAEAPPLTAREIEIMELVAAGLQNKEIAAKLGLSLATVRNHVHNSLEKLDLHSKLEMVSLAFRKGWVRRPAAGPKA
jgi:DNA-binding CsgD family transcriptional regulator